MQRLAALLTLTAGLALPGAALAFNPATLSEGDASIMLDRVIRASFAAMYCTSYGGTEADENLLDTTADMIAYQVLDLSVDDYDEVYYGPVFDDLEKGEAAFCAVEGPKLEDVLAIVR